MLIFFLLIEIMVIKTTKKATVKKKAKMVEGDNWGNSKKYFVTSLIMKSLCAYYTILGGEKSHLSLKMIFLLINIQMHNLL
uniref:ATP synthase F0 subunit 8 n=1 Tax=Eleutherocaulis alte TaxID=74076 RepID=A0A1P7YWC6_9EUPU|nr:ATP synthase F0 subunit 8 [Eleutherocaulis alte]